MTLPLAGAKAQQWTTNALPPGLVAWWQAEGNFTETVGNLVTTPSGGPQFVADGRIGQAVRFNGSSQWARITSGGLARARGEVTVAAWIRPRASQGGSYTWGHVWFESTGSTYGGADNYTRLSLTVNSGGTVRMTGRDSEDGTVFAVNTTNTIASSTWTHIVGTWKSGEGLKLYLDGTLNNSLVVPALGPFTTSAANYVMIGAAHPTANTETFNGDVDDLMHFGRALTAAEVAYLAGAANPYAISIPGWLAGFGLT
ncbi:MAG: LamG domain-containing protein, partial [Verrucomicrobiota bacterium]